MTEAQALRDLAPPLIFGDAKQIAAHKWLERLNESEERFKKCEEGPHSNVDAAGGCGCLENFPDEIVSALKFRRNEPCNCEMCDGEGTIECPECDGSGVQ